MIVTIKASPSKSPPGSLTYKGMCLSHGKMFRACGYEEKDAYYNGFRFLPNPRGVLVVCPDKNDPFLFFEQEYTGGWTKDYFVEVHNESIIIDCGRPV